MKSYQELLRDLVREQGEPVSFQKKDVRLDDEQLAIAMKHYDDALVEVAGEIAESVIDVLRFKQQNGFVQMLKAQSHYEAIGLSLIAGCRNRLLPKVSEDAALKADEMASEDLTDAEAEEHV